MQYEIPEEKEGCFVFQVVNDPICVRSQPNILPEDKTRLEFEVGELAAVDLIEKASDHNNGPYLRLTDRSGWLFCKSMGQERMKMIDVERGLWALHVDNFPFGQYLRRHPVVSPDLDFEINGDHVLYEPGTKIYCDAKVIDPKDGIAFYRVQGTRGWVFDHMPRNDGNGIRTMLIEETKVRNGFFCYQANEDVVIRQKPNTDPECMTREIIKAGQMVTIDFIRDDPVATSDGPFLRLSDGAGWLFEKKQGIKMMTNRTICVGSWELKVLNPPVGVGLRRHPIVCQDKLYPVVYPTESLIQCDRRIVADDGTIFYRVIGTRGWVFDRRGTNMVLELLSSDECNESSMHDPWDLNFVRGIAATVEGIEEKNGTIGDKTGNLFFERPLGTTTLLFQVFCKTRTVTAFEKGEHPVCQRNCSTKRLIRFFNCDPVEFSLMTSQASRDETVPTNKEKSCLAMGNSENSDTAQFGAEASRLVELEVDGTMVPELDDNEQWGTPECKEHDEGGHQNMSVSLLSAEMAESDQNEIALRKQLFDLERKENDVRLERLTLLRQIKYFDDERCAAASICQQLARERIEEMRAKEDKLLFQEDANKVTDLAIPRQQSVRQQLAEETTGEASEGSQKVSFVASIDFRHKATNSSHTSMKSQSLASRKRGFACGECDLIFPSAQDREVHCRDKHGIECEVCGRVCKSFRALDLHKDAENHW